MTTTATPNSQFHPYEPERSTPHSERQSGLRGMLSKVGLDESRISSLNEKMRGVNVRGKVDSARGYARDHGAVVLGSMAALAIGAGLLRRRSMMSR